MKQPQQPPKRRKNSACKSRIQHDEPLYYEERPLSHYSPTTTRRIPARDSHHKKSMQQTESDLVMQLEKRGSSAAGFMAKTTQKETCASRDKTCKPVRQHEIDY